MKYPKKTLLALNILKKINPVDDVGNTNYIIAVEHSGQSLFYCKYCKKVHKHGLGSGYRTPHCFENGYRKFGDYYLLTLSAEEIIEAYLTKYEFESLGTRKSQINI